MSKLEIYLDEKETNAVIETATDIAMRKITDKPQSYKYISSINFNDDGTIRVLVDYREMTEQEAAIAMKGNSK